MSLVSVIIPVYNHERLVHECAESILKQSYKNIEMILVNDFSTDCSAQVCKELSQNYENVIYIEQEFNQGPLAARVRGIKESKGEYVVFCDADDMLPGNCIESLVTAQETMKTDLIIGNFAQKYEDKIVDNKNRLEVGSYHCKELLEKQIDDGSMSGILVSSQCGKLYKRQIINKFVDSLPLNVRINEDGVFNTYYLLNATTVGVIPDRVYLERSRKRTAKKQVDLNLFTASNAALMNLRNQWPDKENFDQQMKRRQVSTTFILSLWVCNHAGFMKARKQLRKLWKELELKKIQDSIPENKMRIYKKFFYKLMKYRCYLLFYAGIRISPLIRKHVAR